METRFFDRAPIGDPKDPRGQKRLSVMSHPQQKDDPTQPGGPGFLLVVVDDVNDVPWIEVSLPVSGLILAGMPADFLDPKDPGDPEIMLELLDRACAYIDDWRKRRMVILPKPASDEPEVTVEQPVTSKAKAKA